MKSREGRAPAPPGPRQAASYAAELRREVQALAQRIDGAALAVRAHGSKLVQLWERDEKTLERVLEALQRLERVEELQRLMEARLERLEGLAKSQAGELFRGH